ncbi:AP-3 complex subunit mu-1 [Smittium culicis]|uniref:AP-3 complex subunit mu-1 n=2 Tax=Smittium culicis TaxID=133412 RepID=A0A1R1YB90_9FUNG|nr:AP-3 complex subunit mu-1 [Smittium culicis]OMJ24199.1 AP-3 complex subunit mu-1 [Smittium culicis]
MPIDSLFILTESGTCILEKHYRNDSISKVASLTISKHFSVQLSTDPSFQKNDPIYKSPLGPICIFLIRDKIVFCCVVSQEEPPIVVLEFINHFVEVLDVYIGKLSVQSIKDNFIVIYELLSEMIDEGHIIITDVAELTGIVPIPNLLQGVIESVSGFGIGKSHLKTARIETENQYWRANSYTSNSANKNLLVGSENSPNILPWRKNFKTESGRDSISYTNNESFFDFEEKISTVVDSTGNLVSYDIMGSISANCKVNGMPEIKIILNHPKFIDDCWFHQCVRLKIFESSKVLSFIPPDGKFKLANYSIKHEYIDKLKILPLIVDFSKIDLPKTSFSSSSDNPDPQSSTEQLGYNIKLHPNFNASKTISNVTVTIPISSSAYNIDAKCSAGNYSVDSANSLIKWQIGDISASKKNNIQIRFKFSLKPPGPSAKAIANANANANSISVDYSLLQTSVSGLKIDAIKVFNLKKDMFKGAKYSSVAGNCSFRFY